MVKVAELVTEVRAETRDAEQGLERVGRRIRDLQNDAGRGAAGFASLGQSANVAGLGMARVGVVFGGVGAAVAATTVALGAAAIATKQLVDIHIEQERTLRATSAAYGEQAGQFTTFAQRLSDATGFTKTAILEAALSARTLSQNYGLSITQTQRLIEVSTNLARVRGIGVAESFERIQSAIRGEAEASEYLGLTLNETFLKTRGLREAMTDAEKAQIRFNEVLRQSAQFNGLAAQAAQGTEGAFARLENATNRLGGELGKLAAGPAGTVADKLGGIAAAAAGAAQMFNEAANNTERLLRALSALPDWLLERFPGGAQTAEAVRGFYSSLDVSRSSAAQQRREREDEMQERREAQRRATEAAERAAREAMLTPIRSHRGSPTLRDDTEKRLAELANQEAGIQINAERQMLGIRERQRAADEASRASRLAVVGIEDQIAAHTLASLGPKRELEAIERRIRDLNSENLDLTMARLRAERDATPANRRLEDMDFERQRLTLQIDAQRAARRQRGTLGIDIAANRRALRALDNQRPLAELAALEANRGVTLIGREQDDDTLNRRMEAIGLEQGAQGLRAFVEAQDALGESLRLQLEQAQAVVDGHDRLRASLAEEAQGVAEMAQALRDKLQPEVLKLRDILLGRERAEANETARGTNAPGSGAGLRSMKESDPGVTPKPWWWTNNADASAAAAALLERQSFEINVNNAGAEEIAKRVADKAYEVAMKATLAAIKAGRQSGQAVVPREVPGAA